MISLVVFIACLTAANAKCSCKPFESLMEAFCQSDYALLATVKKINFVYGELPTNDTNTTDGGKWSYYIWHSGKTWKGPIVAASLLTTPNSEDACGVPGLSANVEYFLTGKLEGDEFTFTSCDFVMPSSDLAPQEYELLMQLMWYPKKCAEKHDEHGVKDDEKKPEGNDEKSVEEGGEKKVEGNDEEKVEEGGEKTVEGNDEKKVEEGGEKTVEGNDEEKVEEEKTVEGNDEEKVEEGGEKTVEGNDEEKVEEGGEKTVEGNDEEKVEEEKTVEGNDEEKVEEGGEKTVEGNDEQA
ncbi:hypothetical protein Aduo_010367 [Ancylostoma duodenale]